MNDPRHPPQHRPMPKPAAAGGLIDPLVETSHAQVPNAPKPASSSTADKIRITDDEPIALVDDEVEPAASPVPASPGQSKAGGSGVGMKPGESFSGKKIIAFERDSVAVKDNFKRTPVKTGHGACRVKSFHGKYSDEGLRYLDNAINAWLDDHAEIEVKFVTSTVMTFEGKIREPALVLNVWY